MQTKMPLSLESLSGFVLGILPVTLAGAIGIFIGITQLTGSPAAPSTTGTFESYAADATDTEMLRELGPEPLTAGGLALWSGSYAAAPPLLRELPRPRMATDEMSTELAPTDNSPVEFTSSPGVAEGAVAPEITKRAKPLAHGAKRAAISTSHNPAREPASLQATSSRRTAQERKFVAQRDLGPPSVAASPNKDAHQEFAAMAAELGGKMLNVTGANYVTAPVSGLARRVISAGSRVWSATTDAVADQFAY